MHNHAVPLATAIWGARTADLPTWNQERENPLTAFITSEIAPGVVDVLQRNGYSLTVDQVEDKRVHDVATMVEPDNEGASTLLAFCLADYMRRHAKLRSWPDNDEPEQPSRLLSWWPCNRWGHGRNTFHRVRLSRCCRGRVH